MRQLQKTLLQKVHLPVEKKLSFSVSRHPKSSSFLLSFAGIPVDHSCELPYLRGVGLVQLDRRTLRVVQEDQMR
jgi:hypothetical protein